MDMEKDGTQHTKKTQSVQETETQKSETLSTSTPDPETMEISVAEVEATSMKTHTGEGQRQTQASESQATSEGRITTVNETQTTKATEGQTTTTANTRAIPQSARYRRLVTSSSTALAHAVKSLTYKRVAACYPSIAKTPAGQEALREALKQICKAWTDSVQTEFDAILISDNSEIHIRRGGDSGPARPPRRHSKQSHDVEITIVPISTWIPLVLFRPRQWQFWGI